MHLPLPNGTPTTLSTLALSVLTTGGKIAAICGWSKPAGPARVVSRRAVCARGRRSGCHTGLRLAMLFAGTPCQRSGLMALESRVDELAEKAGSNRVHGLVTSGDPPESDRAASRRQLSTDKQQERNPDRRRRGWLVGDMLRRAFAIICLAWAQAKRHRYRGT